MKKETPNKQKPMMIGINHIALEVGNVKEALNFYGKIFNFRLRGESKGMAFIDLGDQFIALFETKKNTTSNELRHFGLVVDNRMHVEELAKAAGANLLQSEYIEFYDPWGNLIQIIEYKDVQFSKTPKVLEGMGIHLEKTQAALDELAEKNML